MVWTISSTKLRQLGKFSSQGLEKTISAFKLKSSLSVCWGKNKKKQPLLCRVWVKPYLRCLRCSCRRCHRCCLSREDVGLYHANAGWLKSPWPRRHIATPPWGPASSSPVCLRVPWYTGSSIGLCKVQPVCGFISAADTVSVPESGAGVCLSRSVTLGSCKNV